METTEQQQTPIEKRKVDEEKDKELFKEWLELAKNPESVDALIEKLSTEYEHDYGSIVHAMFTVMIAAMSKMNNGPQGGITSFQASCLGWMMIRHLFSMRGDHPLRLVDYDEMLYPQYADKFMPTISSETWQYLQDKAKKKLEDIESLRSKPHDNVVDHWQLIAAGNVPFGYRVQEEN